MSIVDTGASSIGPSLGDSLSCVSERDRSTASLVQHQSPVDAGPATDLLPPSVTSSPVLGGLVDADASLNFITESPSYPAPSAEPAELDMGRACLWSLNLFF